jgi:hypothetical protein
MPNYDHPAYHSPNYARLFAEAIAENIRDYYSEHRELLVPGHWVIKLRKHAPLIPARTFWCDHEPGNPENKLDRWPLPFIAGEIAGDIADPLDIFGARDRAPLEPRGGLTIEQEYAYRVADIRHARRWRPDHPIANPTRRVVLSRMPIPFAEDH